MSKADAVVQIGDLQAMRVHAIAARGRIYFRTVCGRQISNCRDGRASQVTCKRCIRRLFIRSQ